MWQVSLVVKYTLTRIRLSVHKLNIEKVDIQISLGRTAVHQLKMNPFSCLNVQHTAERGHKI